MTILDACIIVLDKSDSPMKAEEIYRQIVEQQLFEFKAKDPLAILRSALRKHMRGAGPHRVVETQPKTYKKT